MPPKPHKVCLLAYDQLCLFEFAAAGEVFKDRSAYFGDNWYQLVAAALEPGPLTSRIGMALPSYAGLEAVLAADTVIVPGWREGPVPESMIEGLVEAHRRGVRIVSICTGAFVLAAAGLLDGRRATTHWEHTDELAAAYPKVQVDASVLYVDEGDIVTSAGSAAGIDMMLHLVRKDYGARACNRVARQMVIPPHREGGQAQYIAHAVAPVADTAFTRVLDHIRNNPAADHVVEDLAVMAAMSLRSFFRRFRDVTGHTPHDWIVRERIRLAKELLETTDKSVDAIAYETGFGAPDTLRHHFRRHVGAAPSDFRALFRRVAAE